MTRFVHLTPAAEPLGLHPTAKETERVYAVQLALEVTTGDEDNAKADFDSFLAMLLGAEYFLIQIDNNMNVVGDPVKLERAFTVSPGADAPDVSGWLERAKAEFARLSEQAGGDPKPDFFLSKDRLDADMRNARAVDLLRGAWRWPAPLAQRAGLVSAVRAPLASGNTEFLIMVPKDNEEADLKVVKVEKLEDMDRGDRFDVTMEWTKPEKGESIIRTAALEELDLVMPKRFGKTGVYHLPDRADDLQRLSQRIEERAASLLWPATVLGSLAADAQWKDAFAQDPGGHLFWITQASALSMFDVAVGGLLLPVSNEPDEAHRRSFVLERLTRLVAGTLEAEKFSLDVNERALYLNLHRALWAGIAAKTPVDVWASIATLVPEGTPLEFVEKSLKQDTAFFDEQAEEWEAALDRLSGELGKLALLLESEAGAEGWLIGIFDETISPDNDATLYTEGTGITATQAHLKEIYKTFIAGVAGEFDAAAALRHEFGNEALAAVLARVAGQPNTVKKLEAIRKEISESGALSARFKDPIDGVFDALWTSAFETGPIPANLKPVIAMGLETNLNALIRDPEAPDDGTGAKPIFRPDTRPQPLMLPLADRPSDFAMDGPLMQSSGLGFLVQAGKAADAAGPFMDTPAHLSLVGLQFLKDYDKPENKSQISPTLDPVMPVPAPGTAGMFLPYAGTPLSSPSQISPVEGGQSDADRALQEVVEKLQPYAKLEAEYEADWQVPELAYGMAYRAAACWVPPSGVLPQELREKTDPFQPKLLTDKTSEFWPNGDAWVCQRRTAISETAVKVDAAKFHTREVPEGVHPISVDDPRIALERLDNAHRHRDIYRGGDGKGVLQGDVLETFGNAKGLTLRELRAAKDFTPDMLAIHLMTRPDDDEAKAPRPSKIRFDRDAETLTLVFDGLPKGPFWLRMSFTEAAALQCLSFADPQNALGQSNADRVAAPVLLAPDAGDAWTLPNNKSLELTGPRVTFEDLERWAANSELWTATCGKGSDHAAKIIDRLRRARVLFETIDDPFAEKMKALPDPAVTGLVAGLAQSDRVVAPESEAFEAVEVFLPVAPYVVEPGDLPDTAVPGDKKGFRDWVKSYRAFVDGILVNGAKTLNLSPGDLSLTTADLTVPAGTAAHLRISPAVRKAHFAPASRGQPLTGIFDPRMTQLAVGTYTDSEEYTLFGGPDLAVEVMHEAEGIAIPAETLAVQLMGRERGFKVLATPARDLKLFSQAELVTQRWRFSGRPIYRWIDVAPKRRLAGPVVEVRSYDAATKEGETLSRQPAEALAGFEEDAFAGRDISDGDYRRVRLRPATETTELGTFSWPERSATYYRHRVEMISRYAGAMRSPAAARRRSGTSLDPWARRVAVLAEPDAAPVGRPQFRAFLPTQRRVRDNDKPQATPITCVLSEPPFAQLGLADRLDAEIAVVNRYTGEETLKVDGLRKEISPDPRLSYFRVGHEESMRAAIRPEGPAGLHFDRPGTSNPAWSNAQFLFHLDVPPTHNGATMEELEESFAGIVLSRHSDPGWSWVDPAERKNTGLHRDLWIEPGTGLTEILTGGNETLIHAKLERSKAPHQGKLRVMVLKSALFKDGGDDDITLWEGPAQACLFKPLGDNRYRLSIYAGGGSDVADDGTIARPRLVASAILTIAGMPELRYEEEPWIAPTAQSEATVKDWARSGRDLLHLTQGRTPDPKIPEQVADSPVSVAGLDARLQKEASGVRLHFHDETDEHLRVRAPVATRRYPLHAHRRLLMILRRGSKQLGHQIDLFLDASLADDWGMAQTRLDDKIDQIDELSLVMAELECRAEIACISGVEPEVIGKDPRYARYQDAPFDLRGAASDQRSIRQVRFHIRAATRALDLSKLTLQPHSDLVARGDVNGIVAANTPILTWAFDALLLPTDDDRSATLRITGRDVEGHTFADEKVIAAKDESANFETLVRNAETVMLGLSDSGEGESWVDISMLTSRREFVAERPDAFDFDWLFGAEDESDRPHDLPGALAPETLNQLPEAQCRIIGLADPIRVRRNP
ncbi:hypothetical protein [Sedimentitalea sp.]|uniref:hypothetical protein n=1 Tax=Sedimentitalea sp. TaxID=2048915 RepID=UPI0032976B84